MPLRVYPFFIGSRVHVMHPRCFTPFSMTNAFSQFISD